MSTETLPTWTYTITVADADALHPTSGTINGWTYITERDLSGRPSKPKPTEEQP